MFDGPQNESEGEASPAAASRAGGLAGTPLSVPPLPPRLGRFEILGEIGRGGARSA